jgi:hypothetical protein
MVPIIYTTYGTAMGHQPETLAASGGLKPAGGGRKQGLHRPTSERLTDKTRAALASPKSVACYVHNLLRSLAAVAFGLPVK